MQKDTDCAKGWKWVSTISRFGRGPYSALEIARVFDLESECLSGWVSWVEKKKSKIESPAVWKECQAIEGTGNYSFICLFVCFFFQKKKKIQKKSEKNSKIQKIHKKFKKFTKNSKIQKIQKVHKKFKKFTKFKKIHRIQKNSRNPRNSKNSKKLRKFKGTLITIIIVILKKSLLKNSKHFKQNKRPQELQEIKILNIPLRKSLTLTRIQATKILLTLL